MHILSKEQTKLDGKAVMAVLTIGVIGKVTGAVFNDMAVYYMPMEIDVHRSRETIARQGTKATHAQSVKMGYKIAEKNYRK